jgi:hypothetical protein
MNKEMEHEVRQEEEKRETIDSLKAGCSGESSSSSS